MVLLQIASWLLQYAGVVKVFKKLSPDGFLTVYLGSRDFGDHGSFCDPIEGVIIVSTESLRGKKVFGQVITTFRYGREEDEVMGLHFARQLYLTSEQVVPPKNQSSDVIVSDLQNKLLKRFGEGSYPFTFDLPKNAPPSVTLQPSPDDQGAPLGVEYELRFFLAEEEADKPKRRSTVAMAIRKLQYSLPLPITRQPSSIVSKGFMLSPGKLTLEVSLDKDQYFHGDQITVHVSVTNHSKKTVRSVKSSVIQHTEVTLVAGHYSKNVASIESREGCPITPGANYTKIFNLLPTASANKDRRGIALDGMLKEKDTNLATSTLNTTSDSIGIIISYVVRVRLYLGAIGGDLTADVPFTLANMEPGAIPTGDNQDLLVQKQAMLAAKRRLRKQMTREMSADLIFEDFARRRQASLETQTE